MELIMNKNKILNSIKLNRMIDTLNVSSSKKMVFSEDFFFNDKLKQFPFELLDIFKDLDPDVLEELPPRTLYNLNSLKLDLAKHIVQKYSASSISILSNSYTNEELLNEVCDLPSEDVDSLLSFNLHLKKQNVNPIDIPTQMTDCYLRLVIEILNSYNNSKEDDLAWLKIYFLSDDLEIISTLFHQVYLLADSNKSIPSNIYKHVIDIIKSNFFIKLSEHDSTAPYALVDLWKLWIFNDISKDALDLISDMYLNHNGDMSPIDVALVTSILNSEVKLGTKFKYDELKKLYDKDLYVLFKNFLGQHPTLILQKEVNALLKERADINNPYKSIYGEDSTEFKYLENINDFSRINSIAIKELILSKKVPFLESLYNHCNIEKNYENMSKYLVRKNFMTNILDNYNILDKLIHLNTLNASNFKQLQSIPMVTIENILDFLEDVAATKELPRFLYTDYKINEDVNLYNGEKFNFDELMLLSKSTNSFTKSLLLVLKKLNIKNSRVLNICNEISKSTYIVSSNDLCFEKIVNIVLDFNSLYLYREKNPATFGPIKNISNLVYSIFNEDELIKLNAKSEDEIDFVRKKNISLNMFILKGIKDISSVQRDLCLNDQEMKRVLKMLEVDDTFINKNFDNILKFYTNGLAKVVDTLSTKLSGQALYNLPLIVKAELTGSLKTIKYLPQDYEKEIKLPVSDIQKELWKKNFSYKNSCEADDFETTIRIGQYPVATCQSWSSSGYYAQSILSNFDTNKKILVHKDESGTITTRAILRLTKMTYDDSVYHTTSSASDYSDFGFKDVTKDDILSDNTVSKPKEELVLFLERAYSYLDRSQLNFVHSEFFELARQKAKEMGVKLVISNLYDRYLEKNEDLEKHFESKSCYIYISKSKNGTQYLDSLSGHNESSDSERYVRTQVYM